jgi:hypothetical protein
MSGAVNSNSNGQIENFPTALQEICYLDWRVCLTMLALHVQCSEITLLVNIDDVHLGSFLQKI